MTIYSEVPNGWKDLQAKVAQLLSDVGYECEVEKDIQTARETINIDVYATRKKATPQVEILCECKHWSNRVPKTVVHAFRTAVSDFGANLGMIISKAGFQSGSYEAAKNTNILLLNWTEFQDYFKFEWIKSKQFLVAKKTKPLYDYVSAGFLVFFKKEYNGLTVQERAVFDDLNRKYFDYAFNSSNLDYKDLDTNEFDTGLFEMLIREMERKRTAVFTSYQQYYDFLLEKCEEGVQEFDNLFGEKLRRSNSV